MKHYVYMVVEKKNTIIKFCIFIYLFICYRIVTGGNAKSKDHVGSNSTRRRNDESFTTSVNNTTRICPKFLDNDIQTTWINPRLISKVRIFILYRRPIY